MKKKPDKRKKYRADWVRFGRWLEDQARVKGHETHAAIGKVVGVDRSMVSHVLSGRVPLPQERIMEWADKLGFPPKERRIFLRGAWFSHAPPEAFDLLHDVDRQLVMAKRRIEALKRRIDGIPDPE